MADRSTGFAARTMWLVIIAALAVLALAAWRMGFFAGDTNENTRTVYKAGVRDESGGELIVTDPEAPRVEDLKLPETAMTPVPVDDEARPPSATATGTK